MSKSKGYIQVVRLERHGEVDWVVYVLFPGICEARVMAVRGGYRCWSRSCDAMRFANRLAGATGYEVTTES